MTLPQFELIEKQGHYRGLLLGYLQHKNLDILVDIVKNSSMKLVNSWCYDNWNGGQYEHRVALQVKRTTFYSLLDNKNDYEKEISQIFNKIYDEENEHISVNIISSEEDDDYFHHDADTRHLGFHSVENAQRLWGADSNPRVFISHRDTHKKEATYIKDTLKGIGISSFVAHKDIEPTKLWEKEIRLALSTMDIFLALLTDDFFESVWTNQEVGVAFAKGIPIIPLKHTINPKGFISSIQALPYQREKISNDIVQCIFLDCSISASLKNKLINSLIAKLKTSNGWESAEKLWEIISKANTIDKLSLDLLVEAFNTNGQVNSCVNIGGYDYRGNYRKKSSILEKIKQWTDEDYSISTNNNKITLKKTQSSLLDASPF